MKKYHFMSPGMGHNSVEYLHTLIEALRLSFADALNYLADPSKVAVPIQGMLSKKYAQERKQLIRKNRWVRKPG